MPRHSRPCRRVQGLLCTLFAVAQAAPATAESATPFSPPWREVVERTFFADDGEISPAKLGLYREGLEQRRRELRAVLRAHYRATGRTERQIRKRLKHKRQSWVYDQILGEGDTLGLLDLIWDAADADEAQRMASTVLELDYALRVAGERPFSLSLLDSLGWTSIRHWTLEARTRAVDAEREASNLWNPQTGRFYEAQDLRRLITAGEDISRLEPDPRSTLRRAPERIADVDVRAAFYEGGAPLSGGRRARFPAHRATVKRIRKSPTQPYFELQVKKEGGRRGFKLRVGGEIHSEPTANALLTALGFNADVTRYVHDFRLDLGVLTLEELRAAWRAHFGQRRPLLRDRFDDYFAEGQDAEGRYLTLREGVLEAKPKAIVRVGPWPFGGNGNDGRREVRGLGIFSAWVGNTDLEEAANNTIALRLRGSDRFELHHLQHDLGHSFGRRVGEQLDAFPWSLVSRTATGRIKLNYHSTGPSSLRSAITHADARWMTRQIAQLTRRQITDAVAIGYWPRAAGQLLVEKLIQRRNELVEALGLLGEATPSGPLELLRVDRQLTTADGAVTDGTLRSGRFEGSTQEFSNYWEELLGPIWERVALRAVRVLQDDVGRIAEWVFDPESVGLPVGLVAELLVNVKRDVEENPRPTSSRDSHLTRDTLLLGARLGGGVIGRGEVALYRKLVMITPAATEHAAHYSGNRIFNLLLPRDVRRGALPKSYVLVRETYLEGRGRLITDDLTLGAALAGAEATAGRIRVSRDVVSVRGDDVHVYRDLSWIDRAALRAFLKLVFVRVPLGSAALESGERAGELYSLRAALARDRASAESALALFVERGDPRGLDAVADRALLDSEFSLRETQVELGSFWSHLWRANHDALRVRDPRAEAPTVAAFTQDQLQLRRSGSFLDFGHSYGSTVRASRDDSVAAAIGPLELILIEDDRYTRSEELGRGPIAFANAIGSAGAEDPLPEDLVHLQRIEFTPQLHSANQHWGHLHSTTRVGFSQRAVAGLLALEPDTYWPALARQLNLSEAQLARYANYLRARGKRGRVRARLVPPRIRRAVARSLRLLDGFRAARQSPLPELRQRRLVEALSHSTPRRQHGFDPRLLATLRTVLGAREVSVEARIHPLPWREERLFGSVDLVLQTHAAPFRPDRAPLALSPHSAAQVYDMLPSLAAALRRAQPWPGAALPEAAEEDSLELLEELSESRNEPR